MTNLIKSITAVILSVILFSCNADKPEGLIISKEALLDKIKGGWAGQTIGCTYGGPTEFGYAGKIINDSVEIKWPEHYIKWYYENAPGLYDDVYMDLTFVDIFDKYGLDAPVDSFANAFANAEYPLWHANQAARYNILRGLMPPQSGHWTNNPHADDIDFQIEADFAGLMCPGLPVAAAVICDSIGHIMNYGDGWYGGVYVAEMYSLAYVYNDINTIVTEALKAISAESHFYKVMSDVITWHKQYPDDWHKTWQAVEDNYDNDLGCPCCVYQPINIDASINCAYILIGLLYGDGDFDKTIDIATRCGQDSDCNPASAGGILGTMIGYSNIPSRWMDNLREVEDMNFAYTDISLNKVYQMSLDQALQIIKREGGAVDGDNITIRLQQPETVRFEKSFENTKAVSRTYYNWQPLDSIDTIQFDGNGFVLRGAVKSNNENYVALLEVTVDNQPSEFRLPADLKRRSDELCWKFELPDSHHTIQINWLNPDDSASIQCESLIVYSK